MKWGANIPKVIFNDTEKIDSEQFILALFGEPVEEVAKRIRDDKNNEYEMLFKKKSKIAK